MPEVVTEVAVVELVMIAAAAIAVEPTVALPDTAVVDFAAAMEPASAGTMDAQSSATALMLQR